MQSLNTSQLSDTREDFESLYKILCTFLLFIPWVTITKLPLMLRLFFNITMHHHCGYLPIKLPQQTLPPLHHLLRLPLLSLPHPFLESLSYLHTQLLNSQGNVTTVSNMTTVSRIAYRRNHSPC